MDNNIVKTDSYKQLVVKVKAELDGLELLVKQETALRYWKTGKYISEYFLDNQQRAGYGDYIYDDLAEDVGRTVSTLRLAVQIYRTYPILLHAGELSLRHYQALVTVKDNTKRKQLEKQAIQKGWDSNQLRKYIAGLYPKKQKPDQPAVIPTLTFTRGRLNTFRLLESEMLPSGGESGILIDCGFGARAPLADFYSGSNLAAGDYIEAVYPAPRAKERGFTGSGVYNGTKYVIKKVTVSEDELFTYQARVVKISDGDSLWVFINPGFGVYIEQDLRLRGIDCPELSTKAGQRAKQFVESQLKGLDFIIIKTYRDQTEKYGRYLADVFYLKDEPDPKVVLERGTFLNQKLLDLGLAKVMED